MKQTGRACKEANHIGATNASSLEVTSERENTRFRCFLLKQGSSGLILGGLIWHKDFLFFRCPPVKYERSSGSKTGFWFEEKLRDRQNVFIPHSTVRVYVLMRRGSRTRREV